MKPAIFNNSYLAKWAASLMLFCMLITCNNNDIPQVIPEASFSISPINCLTTDTLILDASTSFSGGQGAKIYFKWDWNHDGIWDTEYSKIPTQMRRFYTPGDFRPILSVLNSFGYSDTVSLSFSVEQGYSAPHPILRIIPSSGNYKTIFTFDASDSYDDEDSLKTLQFRWDFDGDGYWDTHLSDSPIAHHTYKDTGQYEVLVEVMDPGNLRSRSGMSVQVNNKNPILHADFSWSPIYGTTGTQFTFSASSSYYENEPFATIRYSWRLPPLYEWSEWSSLSDTILRFEREAKYELELKVRDSCGLDSYCKKDIQIYHENLPPFPTFVIGCRRGNIKTQFYFNSWKTYDVESLPSELEFRWDFDGDGYWDTPFSKEHEAWHNYANPGTYKVYMDARDPEGLSDTTAQFVEVTRWNNETGLIHDQRDGNYYGTVKIGSQWWMSQNLNFSPANAVKDEVRRRCYSRFPTDKVKWCNIMGGLYNCYHATREDFFGEVRGICPWGWHIPSRQEWEQLIAEIGGWDQSAKLLPGGETDFNALFAGYSEDGYKEAKFSGLNHLTYYWSFNKMADPFAPNAWNITLQKDKPKILPGWSGMSYYFSVRCVKNND